jgi:hypothetical protein
MNNIEGYFIIINSLNIQIQDRQVRSTQYYYFYRLTQQTLPMPRFFDS